MRRLRRTRFKALSRTSANTLTSTGRTRLQCISRPMSFGASTGSIPSPTEMAAQARIVSYLVLCANSGKELPGDLTIPEQISRNKQPYYAALEAADRELKKGKIDVSAIEELLNAHLANQLYDFYRTISGDRRELGELPVEELNQILEEARHEGAEDRQAVYARPPAPTRRGILKWIEEHQALTGAIATIAGGVIVWLLTKIAG